MSNESRRGFGEHVRHETERRSKRARKVRVRKAIEEANEAIASGDHYRAARFARDKLVPDLIRSQSIREYDQEINEPGWFPADLARFIENTDEYVSSMNGNGKSASTSKLMLNHQGFSAPEDAARVVTTRAVSSLEVIAVHEGLVKDELRNYAIARGFASVVGKMWKLPDMYVPDPFLAVSRDSGLTKTLFHGGTGQGKSSTLGTEAYDRYNVNNPDATVTGVPGGNRYKVIDPIDFNEGENLLYDVPQQDEQLKNIRTQAGQPPTFLGDNDLSKPEVEVLAPLTPGLNQQDLPFNTDTGDPVIKPFTIPASSISKAMLVALMSSKVTPQQESTIRTAYDDVDRRNDDWTLKDLAEEIMARDDLGESYRKRVVKLLDNLQQQGFIRDKTCPHRLNWQRIFNTTDVITCFTQAFMKERVGQLMVAGYIFDILDKERKLTEYPDAAIIIRELHNVTPHRGETSGDSEEEALQETIGRLLSHVLAENRHRGLEFIGDSQDITKMKKGVRKEFNRFVTFNTSKESIQHLFEYTGDTKGWRSCLNSLTKRKGEGAIIGQAQPLVRRDDLHFLAHVEFLPPPFHHRDTDHDPPGWELRANVFDDEELREPSYDFAVPSDLLIDAARLDNNAVAATPMEQFVEECIVHTGDKDDWEHSAAIRRAYDFWANANDEETIDHPPAFGDKFRKALAGDDIELKWRDGDNAYLRIRFTPRGRDYSKGKT